MKSYCPGWTRIGLLTLLALSGCRSHGWTGTWQLNASKSSIPGSTFSMSMTPTGQYREDDGVNSYDFACDGKDYPTSPQHTISCVEKNGLVMETTAKQKGQVGGTTHWELSADGKTLTIRSTPTPSTASEKPTEVSYVRTSGSGGFVGGWRNAKLYAASPQKLRLTEKGKTLHIRYPDTGEYADPTLDGSDSAMDGPTVPDGVTISVKEQSPLELDTVSKYKGVVVNQGTLQLSADGRSLQEDFWRPGSNQKSQLVYERQ